VTDIVSILDEGLGNSSYVVDIGDRLRVWRSMQRRRTFPRDPQRGICAIGRTFFRPDNRTAAG
jgi:hypothetical protein